jgi:diguanylate cyclase (GGDEF)-like protein
MALEVTGGKIKQLERQVHELEQQLREQQAVHNQLVAYAEDLNRTYLELRLRLQQMTALSALATRVARARTLESCARTCLDGLSEIFPQVRSGVFLDDRRGQLQSIAVSSDLDDQRTGAHLEGAALAASAEEEVVTQQQLLGDAPFYTVGVPLVARGKAHGALVAGRAQQHFTEFDIHVIELLGNSAAVAISNIRLYQETRRLAITDPTTGIFNARYFRSTLAQEINKARRLQYPLALIMADIDHFKQFNDTYGHPKGNVALQMVARTIVKCLRQTDTVARYGGEEFSIILPGCDRSALIEVAEKIRLAVDDVTVRVQGAGEPARVTISVGGAWQDPDEVDANILLSRADQALYSAKAAGRDRAVIWS